MAHPQTPRNPNLPKPAAFRSSKIPTTQNPFSQSVGDMPFENDSINHLNSSRLNELVVLSIEFVMTRIASFETRNEVMNLKEKNHNQNTCGEHFEFFEVFFDPS